MRQLMDSVKFTNPFAMIVNFTDGPRFSLSGQLSLPVPSVDDALAEPPSNSELPPRAPVF